MSTTLTNGLKLPDKGSVDWYADMQSNYAILDGAVGTVAEHTTQIAGKAPAVHTHTKADITDFPVYGNAAGTICEGNDSRLSDARTPVAHTHGKADVTDLFNSGNTWGGNQYYTGMLILNSSSDVVEQFRQKLPKDVSTSSDALVRFNTLTDSAGHYVVIESEGHWDTYVAKSIALTYKNDSTKQGSIEFRLRSDGSGLFYAPNLFECDLGNTYNKWKTLNGVNPGALSLPDSPGGSGTVNVNYYDLSSIVTIRDGSGVNSYQPVCDGWIAINSFATWIQIANDTTLVCVTGAIGADGFGQCYLPVRKNDSIRIVINQTNTNFQSFKLIPCQGNV